MVGTLAVDRHGEMRFTYAPGWLADASRPPLSFSLPKRAETFGRRECRPFFEGLLPEESQRDAVARALGLSRGNAFKQLYAAIVQVIAGNADAHGKNYSLLYQGGFVSLSPLYDLLCTVAYPELPAKFAMKIAKRATLEELRRGDWDGFPRDAGLTAPFVSRRVKELPALAQQHATPIADGLAAPGLDGAALAVFAGRIANRAQRLIGTV